MVSARGKLTTEEVAIAFLIGVGLIMMMLAGCIGVALSSAANASFFGMMFLLGLLAAVFGTVLWLVYIRPWEQFDDINVPLDTGHH